MPANIEVKARVRDFAALSARAGELSDTPVEVIPQVDTFFVMERGRLKLRQLAPDRAQLIYYERPNLDGPKRSDYSLFETRDPDSLRELLARALGIRGTVEKVRHLYIIGQTRIHLDRVMNLGDFMELEVVLGPGQSDEEGHRVAERLLEELGVGQQDLMDAAYMDLLERPR
jgi:predicted adenylyl cyclase CyaB